MAAVAAVGLGLTMSWGWHPHLGWLSEGDLLASLTVMGGALLFGAGLVHMSMWRLGEDAARAYAGAVALVVMTLVGLGPIGEVRRHTGAEVALSTALHVRIELRRHREDERSVRAPFDRLSAREKQVLAALCVGRSVTQIAGDWVVSVPTVRTQVRAILTKLDAGSQLEAVAQAHRSGWYMPQQRHAT